MKTALFNILIGLLLVLPIPGLAVVLDFQSQTQANSINNPIGTNYQEDNFLIESATINDLLVPGTTAVSFAGSTGILVNAIELTNLSSLNFNFNSFKLAQESSQGSSVDVDFRGFNSANALIALDQFTASTNTFSQVNLSAAWSNGDLAKVTISSVNPNIDWQIDDINVVPIQPQPANSSILGTQASLLLLFLGIAYLSSRKHLKHRTRV